MEKIIQQQHIKRRRSGYLKQEYSEKRSPEMILSTIQRGTAAVTGHSRNAVRESRRVSVRGQSGGLLQGSFVRSLTVYVDPLYTAMLMASLLFLLAVLLVQQNGSLPGTWIFTGTNLRAPANVERLDSILLEAYHTAGEDGISDLPISLDLSKFERITFTEHVVKERETLSGIALRYGLRMDTLVSFNQINDVRRMQIGSRLQIPSSDGLRHIVRQGESLEGIARRFNTSTVQLIDANNLRSDALSVGQELFIPDARMNDTDLRMALGELFVYPARGRFTSGFGYRSDPFTGVRRFHNGIDIANNPGTRITAARVGRVADQGVHPTYGNYIIISHDGGFQSLYAHLQRIDVRRGQYVSQGQAIGTMGSTGRSTGPHLHFSIFHNGNPVDPLRYLH
ncbi:peptidoglycan DD-metalloendopeptidase family protein [Spirochaeta dissipatitropha]